MSKNTLPHDALLNNIGHKLDNLTYFQQVDCTEELQGLSTELYGGSLFGENALARCSNTPIGPVIELVDRVLTQQDSHGTVPLKVAVIDQDGLDVVQELVFAEWCTNRSIVDNGTDFAYAGLREAVRQSPLANIGQSDEQALHNSVARVSRLRISQHAERYEFGLDTPQALPLRVINRIQHIGELAEDIEHRQAVDIAEVLGTSDQLIPHVLRTPGGKLAVESVLTSNEVLDCSEDGVWAAVAFVGMVGVRDEMFYPRSKFGNKIIDSIGTDFSNVSGARILKAVGQDFAPGEYHDLRNYASDRQTTLQNFGDANATQYQVERSTFPHGELVRGVQNTVPYRIYLPSSNSR